jgi:hypothetical protein
MAVVDININRGMAEMRAMFSDPPPAVPPSLRYQRYPNKRTFKGAEDED